MLRLEARSTLFHWRVVVSVISKAIISMLFITLALSVAWAQIETGTIARVVHDSARGSMPNAASALTQLDIGVARKTLMIMAS